MTQSAGSSPRGRSMPPYSIAQGLPAAVQAAAAASSDPMQVAGPRPPPSTASSEGSPATAAFNLQNDDFPSMAQMAKMGPPRRRDRRGG